MGSTTIRLSTTLAATAALIFTTSASATSPNMTEGIPTRIKCNDVNTCKGQSACKTMTNNCQGQNECKGKGWLYIDGQSRVEANTTCNKMRENAAIEREKRQEEDLENLGKLPPPSTKKENP